MAYMVALVWRFPGSPWASLDFLWDGFRPAIGRAVHELSGPWYGHGLGRSSASLIIGWANSMPAMALAGRPCAGDVVGWAALAMGLAGLVWPWAGLGQPLDGMSSPKSWFRWAAHALGLAVHGLALAGHDLGWAPISLAIG
jgi:hypothetical protein